MRGVIMNIYEEFSPFMNIYEEFSPYACEEYTSGLERQDLDLDEEQE
jgi:hypothetical protein